MSTVDGYHEYIGGIKSTLKGYHEYTGGRGDITSTLGDIMT